MFSFIFGNGLFENKTNILSVSFHTERTEQYLTYKQQDFTYTPSKLKVTPVYTSISDSPFTSN